jgi:ribosomal protein L11 methyltransferase
MRTPLQLLASSSSSSSTDADTNANTNMFDEDTTNVSALRNLTFFNFPKDQEPGILCDLLMEIGACSASIIDADRGTDMEQPLFGEPLVTSTGQEIVAVIDVTQPTDPWEQSLQWAAPMWNRCNVSAHFPASVDLNLVLDLVAETFDDDDDDDDGDDDDNENAGDVNTFRYSSLRDALVVEQVPDRDWVVHVQKSWRPIVVANKFVLTFPWHSETDVEKAVAESRASNTGNSDNDNDSDSLVQLGLQGGIAFGTGEHPTTQLCLEWIDRVVTQHATSSTDAFTVLDYGTGSGVLGMAACKLAPKVVTAVGIDIDVDAIHIANANAADNNVAMRSYLPPLAETADDVSKSLMLKAHAHAAGQLRQRGEKADDLLLPTSMESATYNVVVANILAGPLVALAPTLATMLEPGGLIGMSGILAPQDDMILEAYGKAGFENLSVEKELGGWILVTGNKRQ